MNELYLYPKVASIAPSLSKGKIISTSTIPVFSSEFRPKTHLDDSLLCCLGSQGAQRLRRSSRLLRSLASTWESCTWSSRRVEGSRRFCLVKLHLEMKGLLREGRVVSFLDHISLAFLYCLHLILKMQSSCQKEKSLIVWSVYVNFLANDQQLTHCSLQRRYVGRMFCFGDD